MRFRMGTSGLLAALLVLALAAAALPVSALEPEQTAPVGERPGDSGPAGEHPAEGKEPQWRGAEEPGAAERRTDERKAGDERAGEHKSPAPPRPELTGKQQRELARLYKDLYGTQKKLIGKYAEFGVITKEQASMWLSRLEARYEKLKANGYVPVWKKCRKPSNPE